MLGLGFPQLILILAGLLFMAAGIYGLAPSLVTAWPGGSRGRDNRPQTAQERKAERARRHAEEAKQRSQTPVAAAQKTQTHMVERAPAEAAKPALQEASTANQGAPSALDATFFTPKTKVTALPATPSPAQSSTPATPDSDAAEPVVVDQEVVDELFAEMFSLRATVADLVGEVHQLRSEQRPRRFVIEEVQV